MQRPTLAWTLGDIAGIGPELVAKAWSMSSLHEMCAPVVIGSADVLHRAVRDLKDYIEVIPLEPGDWEKGHQVSSPTRLPCFEPVALKGLAPLSELPLGEVHAAAGRAAFEYLACGIDACLGGHLDGLVTLPLHKEGLHAAGYPYPGHTEILAERTGTREYGMMLYRRGLGVLHVTLHCSVRDALDALSTAAIHEKIVLVDQMMRELGVKRPRVAVAALNPHASDGGLFGNEEAEIILPAVQAAQAEGYDVTGPLPADTLFVRVAGGAFDAVVAMYHDQGHIALKLLGWREAVNITVGLPIIRVSVAHGTAYDIVGRGLADPTSLVEAVHVAARLCQSRRKQNVPSGGNP